LAEQSGSPRIIIEKGNKWRRRSSVSSPG